MTRALRRIIAFAIMVGVGAVLVRWRPERPFDVTAPALSNSHVGWILIGAAGLGALGFNGVFRGGILDDRRDPPGDKDRLV